MKSLKVYTDFDQIDRDLQIMKLERQIDFEKMKLDVADVKRSLSPSRMVSKAWNSATDSVLRSAQKILG
ncbi:DUF6327 family protein [Nonlabens marinus]|nr:DUF6327 family protein [Nonlabens marinus]